MRARKSWHVTAKIDRLSRKTEPKKTTTAYCWPPVRTLLLFPWPGHDLPGVIVSPDIQDVHTMLDTAKD